MPCTQKRDLAFYHKRRTGTFTYYELIHAAVASFSFPE